MSLILSHTSGEWDGTFGVALKALAQDLLSDDEPFGAVITYDEDTVETGLVSDVQGDKVLFDLGGTGLAIPIESIVAIEVPS